MILGIWCFGAAAILSIFESELFGGVPWAVSVFMVFFVLVVITLVMISFQPKSSAKIPFTVPFVPWLPGVSIFINIYLMTMLDVATWARFVVWIAMGTQ